MGTEISNKHNWPIEICNAIQKDRYSHADDLPSDYSASDLIAPVQQTILKKRHKDKLKQGDISDGFWALLGNLVHQLIEENHVAAEGKKVEERLYATVDGTSISGKLDCYHDGEIKDYKSTKAYKIIKGDVESWENQLNIYAFLLRTNGHEVKRLNIVAIIFDWKEHETFKAGYPKSAIVTIPIRLWSLEEQETYIKGRVAALKTADGLVDASLPSCSDSECWSNVINWSVMKYGADRATKNFDTEAEAMEFLRQKGQGYYLRKNKTPKTRCLRYCEISHLCSQWKLECQQAELELF